MGDRILVDPEQVRELAQEFASRQEIPSQSAAEARTSASAIDTGDPGLDGRVRSVMDGSLNRTLTLLTQKLTYTSQWLTRMSENYEDADDEVASTFDAIDPDQPATGPAGGPALVSGLPGPAQG